MVPTPPKPVDPQKVAREYHVSRRFTLTEGLAMLTLFGLLFNGLYFLGAPHALFLFFGGLGMMICFVQMRFGTVPRVASMVTGVVFVILCEVAVPLLFHRRLIVPAEFTGVAFFAVATITGLAIGYGVGAVAAGVFLASDRLSDVLLRWLGSRASASDSDLEEPDAWGPVATSSLILLNEETDHGGQEDPDASW